MAYREVKNEVYQMTGGINTKVSPYDNQVNEFRDIQNLHFPETGAFTKRPGTTLYCRDTVGGAIRSGFEYIKIDGSSYIIASANTNLYKVSTTSFTSIKSSLLNDGIFDYLTFVDRMFCANGQDFLQFDGTNTYNVGLIPPPAFGVTVGIGGGLSGIYQASYGYVNANGFYGQVATAQSINLNGITFGSIIYYNLTAVSQVAYGITALEFYRSEVDGVDLFGTTLGAFALTTVTDPGWPLTTLTQPNVVGLTIAPKFIDIFNNTMFMAGYSSLPSNVFRSDPGDPDAIPVEVNNPFEVRTDDGDIITGLKAYQNQLIITKNKSCHKLQGDNANNYYLQEISLEFGCLSNRTIIAFDNYVAWLDAKGVVVYNGANCSILSNPIEPIIQRINVAEAIQKSWAIHYRKFNEIWFCVPIDSSHDNNAILVYDYYSQKWTTYTGVRPASGWIATGVLGERKPLIGNYTGAIAFFDEVLRSDQGSPIECLFKTKYHAESGQTTEKLGRRFYLNVDPYSGITQSINVDILSNFNATIQVSRTMYQAPFQSRVDFGVPHRSISAEVSHVSATAPLIVYGYTFETRYLRAV